MRHSSRPCSRPVAFADQTRLAGARTAQFGEYKRQEQLTRDQHRALVHVEAWVVVRVVRLACLAPAAHIEEGPGYPLEVVGEVQIGRASWRDRVWSEAGVGVCQR